MSKIFNKKILLKKTPLQKRGNENKITRYQKIKQLGFKQKITLEEGIKIIFKISGLIKTLYYEKKNYWTYPLSSKSFSYLKSSTQY